MIERMKTVCIVANASNKDKMLSDIRDLGVLHVAEKKHADPVVAEQFAALNKKKNLLLERATANTKGQVLSNKEFRDLDARVDFAIEDMKKYGDLKSKAMMEIDALLPWGDFDPSQLKDLEKEGLEFHFYTIGKKELEKLASDQSVRFVKLADAGKQQAIAVVGAPLDKSVQATAFVMPEQGISQLNAVIKDAQARMKQDESVLDTAAAQLASYNDQIAKCKARVEYSSVSETAVTEDALVWITGYIPAADEEKFVQKAKACNWAYALDDPAEDDEHVPTKVKYTKVSGLMEPVFGILGTVPGYHEYDISFWFLLFFSLFFAMIIGDAGYGFIFLALGVALNVKQKKLSNLTLLVYVVSITTIVWGAVTGTWFGLEGAMKVPFLKALVIPAIANYPEYFGMTAVAQQNNVMQFCFIIGTVQLTLACVMNIITKLKSKDLSLMADLGWLISINSLYYIVLLLVINKPTNMMICAVGVVIGFVLVCLFGGMSPDKSFSQGLKSGLANTFTNFLNTISAFGNIMSYIRLFAVGLASLAIAQSFNNMALGLNGFLKVAGILIFVIGHALNLVMGLLSVIVHGVRLNLLEFSGQLGMEWSGTAYEPFRSSAE